MYRVLILVSAFLLAISGMLFLQGGETRDPDDIARAADLSLREIATLSAPANAPIPAPEQAPLNALAAAVAASTGVPAAAPVVPAAPEDPMAAMTASVLAGLGAVAPAAAPGPQDLQGLVTQALRQGQSDAYIDALLNEAAATGRVVVPEALMTAEGKVDTRTLLTSIVAKATAETDALAARLAAEAGAPSRPAAAPAAPTPRPEVYVVEAGDSLAYIALKFYGSPAGFTRIFEANRDQIASPDKIRVGQRLRIPG